jgi:hypothetical protein
MRDDRSFIKRISYAGLASLDFFMRLNDFRKVGIKMKTLAEMMGEFEEDGWKSAVQVGGKEALHVRFETVMQALKEAVELLKKRDLVPVGNFEELDVEISNWIRKYGFVGGETK